MSASSITIHDCLPTDRQRLLLLAALSRSQDARSAWQQWVGGGGPEQLDAGSQRLLPLVAYNLERAGASREEIGAAFVARRAAALASRGRLGAAAAEVQGLADQGIEGIVLKGAALATIYYPEQGLRPMGDLDLLVHTEQALDACRLLCARGYRPLREVTAERIPYIHGENFVGPGLPEIDLHWRLFPERWHPSELGDWWSTAMPLDLCGHQTLSLSAANQLIHVIGHGLVWSPVPGIRWVTDAAMILGDRGPAVDFRELLESATRQRMTLALREGLQLLCDLGIATIPEAVGAELQRVPVTLSERIEHRLARRRNTFMVAGGLPVYLLRYVDRVRRGPDRASPQGFVHFLEQTWGETSSGDVTRRMRRRAALRLGAWWRGEEAPPL